MAFLIATFESNCFVLRSAFLIIVSCLFIGNQASAQLDTISQEVVSTLGGEGQLFNGLGTITYTIGEPIIETSGNSNYFVTQGFHQTQWNVVAVWEYQPEVVEMKLYPNPMSRYLNLAFPNREDFREAYFFTVYDYLYKAVFDMEIESSENRFDLSELPNGTYLMNVTKENGELVKSFKVIKTQ